jgi:nicotinate-nucleotide adenylyltransferase
MQAKERIVIVGGSFSPPTQAHEAIIRACLELPQFDEVWLLPSGNRADKEISMPVDARLQMLEIVKSEVFKNDPRLKVSDFEIRLPRPTKTIATMQALHRARPDTDFWFAYGNDAYLDMPNWEDGATLRAQLKVIIFGSDIDSNLSADTVMTIPLPRTYDHVSSTLVRRALRDHQALDGLVSAPVARYLKTFTTSAARPSDTA